MLDLIGQNSTLLQRKLTFINSFTEKLMKQRIVMKKQCSLRLQSFSVLSRNLNKYMRNIMKILSWKWSQWTKNRDKISSQEIYILTAVLVSQLLADDVQLSLSKRYYQTVLTRWSWLKKGKQNQTGRATRRKKCCGCLYS